MLLAYGLPKATISRLKDGNSNLSKKENQIILKTKVLFESVENEDIHLVITDLKDNLKHSERFVIVTDFEYLLAIDTKTDEKLDIPIEDINLYFDFFLPLAGMEKATYQSENPADIKAASRMAQLYDEIRKDNPDKTEYFNHSLNIFFARILFCYFAEDTNIFPDRIFTISIASHTQIDGSDLNTYLEKVFEVLDTPTNKRENLPEYLNKFPYVNGGLFKEKVKLPKFTKHSRKVIIDIGELDWAAINPDIFGSMFQGVISEEKRGNLGMHYTSVPNIMKVIKPLFLDELYEELEKARGDNKKLNALLLRVRNIKIFDPACGSGNFLIIAYKELRRLEMTILEEKKKDQMILFSSEIKLNHFYGIEIDDFACEIAKLALWLAEHQMHIEVFKKFGQQQAILPLQEAGNIVCGNATRLDWDEVCPKTSLDEIYLLGNPPYLGSRNQEENHKKDMDYILKNIDGYRKLDYISCWFVIASRYIENSRMIRCAFVTTNSICQGEQVSILWPTILTGNINIFFAYESFKWKNNAKSNAGVTVTIIGLSSNKKIDKKIFKSTTMIKVSNINSYLVSGEDFYINKKNQPISNFPEMIYGNEPRENGKLMLTFEEYKELHDKYKDSVVNLIKKVTGANEYINNIKRFCLWGETLKFSEIDEIKERLNKVQEYRITSKRKATQDYATKPYMFTSVTYEEKESLIIPIVSSELRDYLPIGFIDKDTIILNSAQVIYEPSISLFSILNSKMHMTWLKTTAGRLEERYRYSSQLVYNTFPFPKISKKQEEELEECALKILEVRENYPEKTLAQLYDPDKMPEDLREAHRQNDLAVERCYRSKPFESDEERLEYLFKLYEKMIAEEKSK